MCHIFDKFFKINSNGLKPLLRVSFWWYISNTSCVSLLRFGFWSGPPVLRRSFSYNSNISAPSFSMTLEGNENHCKKTWSKSAWIYYLDYVSQNISFKMHYSMHHSVSNETVNFFLLTTSLANQIGFEWRKNLIILILVSFLWVHSENVSHICLFFWRMTCR